MGGTVQPFRTIFKLSGLRKTTAVKMIHKVELRLSGNLGTARVFPSCLCEKIRKHAGCPQVNPIADHDARQSLDQVLCG